MRAKMKLLGTFLTMWATAALAQTYSIDWSIISAGGATLTHGAYSLDGSIGDASAGFGSSSQGYTLEGGFVAGGQPIVPSQWVLRATNGPSARYGNAMAYDISSPSATACASPFRISPLRRTRSVVTSEMPAIVAVSARLLLMPPD